MRGVTNAVPCACDAVGIAGLEGGQVARRRDFEAVWPGAGEWLVPDLTKYLRKLASGADVVAQDHEDGLNLFPVNTIGAVSQKGAPSGVHGVLAQIVNLGARKWISPVRAQTTRIQNGSPMEAVKMSALLVNGPTVRIY